jgi:hypothetical protein
MFIDNQRTAEYNALIKQARVRLSAGTSRAKAKRLLFYVESHHIIPKSLGGDDTAENKVWLTAAEHLKAHLLLVDMVEDTESYRKMLAAAVRMANPQSRTQQRIIGDKMIDNIDHIRAEAARLHGELMSRRHSGENNPFFGRHHSEETKELQRASSTGFKHSIETIDILSEQKMGDLNPSREIVTCDRCGKTGLAGGMRKHHFEHCTSHITHKVKHDLTNEVFVGTREQIHLKTGGLLGNVNNLINGYQQSHKGWRVAKD